MKEDDMDEMMRKAAENYEVDADKAADWNAVYNAVHENEAPLPGQEKKKRRFFAFWWLLLIPLGWIANTEYNKFHSSQTVAKNNSENSISAKKPPADEKKTVPSQSLKNENLPGKNTTVAIDNLKIHQQILPKNFNVKRSNDNLNAEILLNNKQATNSQLQTPGISKTKNNTTAGNIETQQDNIQNQTESSDQLSSNIASNKTADNIQEKIQSSDTVQQKNSLPVVITNETKNKESATAKSTQIKIKTNGHYFYGGLVAGTDLSFIKYQKIQPVGYNVGLLVGYKFNKLSIESGLLLDKKNYYTSGEYFDQTKVPFFRYAELVSANGYCRMYEIPLNIKYDISSHKKHTWFATAGLSSYLMNKELYHYAYKQNGVNGYGSYPYLHTTKNWFSIVNLSAGYQLQMNSKSNLRIEPYYKTTLSGVGTGNLSITSVGLNVGITRRIR
ncbi:MAG: hypothetical protein ABJA35_12435 [Parafilimonas sp.]